MSLKDEIKSNKELEPLFLSYIKYTELMLELDEYNEGMGQIEVKENKRILNSQSSSSDALEHKLKSLYNIDLNSHDSAPLIQEICEHYIKQYSLKIILKMEN